MRIPYQSLDSDTLKALLEEIITREGTDYGYKERTLQEKLDQVMSELQSGNICIEYDVKSDTCTLTANDKYD